MNSWTELWLDENGKTLFIELMENKIKVYVTPKLGEINYQLPRIVRRKKTYQMPAEWQTNTKKGSYLQVEEKKA